MMSNGMPMSTSKLIDSLVFMNDDWFGQYHGLFEMERDGGAFEVIIPLDDSQGIHPETVEQLREHDEDRVVALDVDEVVDYGRVEAFDVFDDWAAIRVDSVDWMEPDDTEVFVDGE